MDVLILVKNHANNNIEFLEVYDKIFEAIDSPFEKKTIFVNIGGGWFSNELT